MAKTGIFFAPGFEEVEALTTVDLCRRGGIEVIMISVDGSMAVRGSHGIGVQMDAGLDEVNFEDFDMLVLPGGMPGTRNLEACGKLMEALDHFYEKGKWIAAICAAPGIFAHRGYLKGRRATSYPSFEKELKTGEAIVTGALAEADGNVITGCGVGGAIAFGLTIVEKLVSAQAAAALAEGIVYKGR